MGINSYIVEYKMTHDKRFDYSFLKMNYQTEYEVILISHFQS